MTAQAPVDRLDALAQRRAALVERAAAERAQVGAVAADLAPAARWLLRGVALAQWLRGHPGPLAALSVVAPVCAALFLRPARAATKGARIGLLLPLARLAIRWMRTSR